MLMFSLSMGLTADNITQKIDNTNTNKHMHVTHPCFMCTNTLIVTAHSRAKGKCYATRLAW